jgi:hypothetical protein
MTAAILRFPTDHHACKAARRAILDAGDNWPLMIEQAVILAEQGDDSDRAFARGVLDAYTRHADRQALVATARNDWWQLALAVVVGVAFGLAV